MKNRIRELRNKRGLTLERMSIELRQKGIYIVPNGIGKYERGEREPKLEMWIKLANYFGVSVGYLQGVEERFEPASELEQQSKHDAIWKGMAKTLRAASVGTITWEEAYQDLKRYQRKSDKLRFEEKRETQQRMFDLALSTFRRDHNEKR